MPDYGGGEVQTKRTEPMTDSELVAILDSLENSAIGSESNDMSTDRKSAEDYYLGRATGRLAAPDGPDRSSIVSRDLLETVEWALPELMEVFLAGDACEFEPLGPQDVEQARQQTKIVNHVILDKNPAFLIFSTWFRDALIQRNGYVLASWDDRSKQRVESYTGLTELQVLKFFSDVQARGERLDVLGMTDRVDDATGDPVMDVKVRITKPGGQVCIRNIPPEHVRVANDAKFSLQDASYAGFLDYPTRSDLISEGIDPDVVKGLKAAEPRTSGESVNRDITSDEGLKAKIDESMETIEVKCSFVKIDYDGDGVAEQRYIRHSGNVVLQNDEAPCVQLVHLTPMLRPHRHIGLSYFDLVADLQEIQTFLKRQLIDNVVGGNHNELAVNDAAVIDYDDFLTRVPNGVLRVNGRPSDHLMPLSLDTVSHRILPVIQAFDDAREIRTGTGRATQGLDPDVLKQSTQGAYAQAVGASAAMKAMIARTFAETGVKDLMRLVQRLMTEYQDHVQQMQIEQQWLPVDPREWLHREHIRVKVGIGHQGKREQQQSLAAIAAMQKEIGAAGVPILTPENVYNLAEDTVRVFSYAAQTDRYFTHPSRMPPKQPEENPLVTVEKLKQRGRFISDQMHAKQSLIDRQLAESAAWQRKVADVATAIAEMELKYGIDLLDKGLGANLEMFKIKNSAANGANGASVQ